LIFVTVGTHYQGFERLISSVDNLVENKKIRDKVIIQIGYTNYIPKNCKWCRFVDPKKFSELCKKSNFVITHGGIGSIIIPFKLKKKIIVVPRLKIFNEHIDDHQLQITKELEKQNKIIAVYDINYLEKAIRRVKKLSPSSFITNKKILSLIKDFIEKMY
jgi:UDP-N-acetylglucosamine transferase subunit ALG13